MNFTNIANFMIQNKRSFMEIRLLIEDPELRAYYENHINKHNAKIMQNIDFPDAGFDLATPYLKSSLVGSHVFKCNKVNKLDLGVKCAAILYGTDGCSVNTGYYMYPRSSISKSCIRLANSTGIIDAGYRGSLIAMVDVVYEEETYLNAYDKMFQICAPTLVPVIAVLVDDLGQETTRGNGGFGSSGL